MDINRLIDRCKMGDADALGELYSRYARRMKGVCRRYFKDEATVEDVLHDAFVIILTSFDRLRDSAKAEFWMLSIVRNVASKHKQHILNMPSVPLDQCAEAEILEDDDNVQIAPYIPIGEIFKMIDKLPDGYGKVFRLSVFNGMTHNEIAAELGIEPKSSSSQLSRAKALLRKWLRKYWAAAMLLALIIKILWTSNLILTVGMDVADIKTRLNNSMQNLDTVEVDYVSVVDNNNPNAEPDTIGDTVRIVIADEPMDIIRIVMPSEILIEGDSIQLLPQNVVEKTDRHIKLHFGLAYSDINNNGAGSTDNYMTMPSVSGAKILSKRLYSWGDYMDYAVTNADKLDSVSSSNMGRVALINSNNPWEPLTEQKFHERPKFLQLSMQLNLNERFALTTGLGCTYMKSNFEAGNEMTIIRRCQRIYYVGIPLEISCKVAGGNRWTAFASGGVQMDVPVSGRVTTQYLYNGVGSDNRDSLIIPTARTRIDVPLQWSAGVGIGLQYRIIPHLSIVAAPQLRWYVPTGGVETFYTEHPWSFALPVGIKFVW